MTTFIQISLQSNFPLEKKPGVISLLAGKPNPSTFPISNIQITVRAPPDADGNTSESQEDTKLDIAGDRLAAGLQYGSTSGWEALVEWVEGLQTYAHGRRKDDAWRVSMGSGSQDLLFKVSYCFFRVRTMNRRDSPSVFVLDVTGACDPLDVISRRHLFAIFDDISRTAAFTEDEI